MNPMHHARRPFAAKCLAASLAAALLTIGSAHAATSANPEAAGPVLDSGNARVIVRLKAGQEAVSLARAAVARVGGRVKLELIGGRDIAVELPKAAVAALRAERSIERVEDDVVRYPYALASQSKAPYKKGQLVPYGISMIQADKLPDLDVQAGNRKVCIMDSGYDNTHEDLPHTTVTGFDAVNGTLPWSRDGYGHGTHVAGTIAALNQSNTGVVGVLPSGKINLYIVRVFSDDGSWVYSSSVANAAKRCQQAGANIINMSLGGVDSSATERDTFDELRAAGVLLVAAAGNRGSDETSYPAGYPSVMSVAAVDQNKKHASFSQTNKDIEIAAPGVGVLSTMPMGRAYDNQLSVDGTTYFPGFAYGSPEGHVSAPLADFGTGSKVNPAMAGKICLARRFNGTFSDSMDYIKALNCERSGGVGLILFNIEAGRFVTNSSPDSSIPVVTVSRAEGAKLKKQIGQTADLTVSFSNYTYSDGTSMAAPHVSGAAALVWSHFPSCTADQIRSALVKSALDLGKPGRDPQFGFGLVQARAAYDLLSAKGCAGQ